MARDPDRSRGGELPFLRRLRQGKLLLGMVHLPPLPGSPGWRGEPLRAIAARARGDAEALLAGGMDGYLIENLGDAPFFKDRAPAHVLTAMTRLALELRAQPGGRAEVKGVNVLRNDALGALAVAFAAGLDCIRVNVHAGVMAADQGIIEGRAAETLRERALLRAPVAVLADLLVKHASPIGSGAADPGHMALDLLERAGADALIISGPRTGAAADIERLRAVRAAAPRAPLLVGSGVTAATLGPILELADGVIAGTALKAGGDVRAPVDRRRVRAFVRAARRG